MWGLPRKLYVITRRGGPRIIDVGWVAGMFLNGAGFFAEGKSNGLEEGGMASKEDTYPTYRS